MAKVRIGDTDFEVGDDLEVPKKKAKSVRPQLADLPPVSFNYEDLTDSLQSIRVGDGPGIRISPDWGNPEPTESRTTFTTSATPNPVPPNTVPALSEIQRRLGLSIAEARARSGLSHSDLTSRTGFSTLFLIRLEQGAIDINLRHLERICNVLNASLLLTLRNNDTGEIYATPDD